MNYRSSLLIALGLLLSACDEQPVASADQPLVTAEKTVEPKPELQAEGPAFNDEAEAAVYFLNPVFPVLDCERVGSIEQGEVDEHFAQLFFYVDRDQNRTVTRNEYLKAGKQNLLNKEEFIFELMDYDKDGIVSALEFRKYALNTVVLADANQDGKVTELEVGIGAKPKVSYR